MVDGKQRGSYGLIHFSTCNFHGDFPGLVIDGYMIFIAICTTLYNYIYIYTHIMIYKIYIYNIHYILVVLRIRIGG